MALPTIERLASRSGDNLLVGGLQPAFDAGADGGRHGRHWPSLTALGGHPQKLELPAVTRTPNTEPQMQPQPAALPPRQRTFKRGGLQPERGFAIGRQVVRDFGEPVHACRLVGQFFHS
jgi:hypothetical protein